MRGVLALLALLSAAPAFADPPTGHVNNANNPFAGYQYSCNTDGCFSAEAQFVIPKNLKYDVVNGANGGPQSGRQAYIWAGIEDLDLAQAGIAVDSNGAGGFTFSAFWECFGTGTGNNNVQTSFNAGTTLTANAGDTIDALVTCTNCTVGMAPPVTTSWTFTVTDVTTSATVTKTGYACQQNDDLFYIALWVIELNNPDNVNIGVMPWSNVKMNGANPNLTATLQMGCSGFPAPCADAEATTGTNNTGSTVNPSVPSGGNAFRICAQSNGQSNAGGTANFAACDATAGTPAGHGVGF